MSRLQGVTSLRLTAISDLAVLCRDPVKGMAVLRAAGHVEATPKSVAAFLRKHNAALDKAQLGQYLGHGNAEEVSARPS